MKWLWRPRSLFTKKVGYLWTLLMAANGYLFLVRPESCMLGRSRKVYFSTLVFYLVVRPLLLADWWRVVGFLRYVYIDTHVACTYKSSIFLIPCHIQAKMKEKINKFLHLAWLGYMDLQRSLSPTRREFPGAY